MHRAICSLHHLIHMSTTSSSIGISCRTQVEHCALQVHPPHQTLLCPPNEQLGTELGTLRRRECPRPVMLQAPPHRRAVACSPTHLSESTNQRKFQPFGPSQFLMISLRCATGSRAQNTRPGRSRGPPQCAPGTHGHMLPRFSQVSLRQTATTSTRLETPLQSAQNKLHRLADPASNFFIMPQLV